ncbi:MAG: polyprenyl synthetase family protein, partial [Methanomassiliicoccaceae archaeon]|nr:polyprenyl synthetase family protein [Methanomassiliicoccaceae archaeon]
IMEGKPTLPTIYAMQDRTHGEEIRKVFQKKEPDWSDVSEAIALIKKTDAIQRCSEKAKKIAENSVSSLNILEDSPCKRSLIGLSNYIVNRNR